MGVLQLGIDYGTSATKVVVRDYGAAGGVRAYPLSWDNPGDQYRLPSTVAFKDEVAWFGLGPHGTGGHKVPGDAVWCGSLKMRVAAQVADAPQRVKAYAAALAGVDLPPGWGYLQLLLTGLVWTLLKAKAKALEITGSHPRRTTFGVTFGLPTDFRHDRALSSFFLSIFRAAFRIAREEEVPARPRLFPADGHQVVLSEALLRTLNAALGHARDMPDEDVDFWHQSEARASTAWAWHSPQFTHGPYVHVDIGAGTTNVAAYLVGSDYVNGTWVRKGIAVFASRSGSVGMDAFQNCNDIRAFLAHNNDLRTKLEEGYRQVFERVRRLTGGHGPPWQEWRHARIVALGGGSACEPLVKRFSFHPFLGNLSLPELPLTDPPMDLVIPPPSPRARKATLQYARRTLAVAYGLSFGHGLPREIEADDIPPIAPAPEADPWTLEGIYAI